MLQIGIALLLPFVALGLQWLFWQWITPFVWFLFFPAVFISARLTGLRGGLLSTLVSTLLVWVYFILPNLDENETPYSKIYTMVLFIIMGYLISDSHQRLRQAKLKSTQALAEAYAAKQQLSELYHKTLELDELKTRFFANISHELRTPLTLIMSPLALRLKEDNLSAEQRCETEMMLRNARQLHRHVSDLLDISKLEAGCMKLAYVKCDLAHLCRLMVSQFDSVAQGRFIDYTFNIPDSLHVELDEEKVQRILINLLSNAFKFTPDHGKISVTLVQIGQQAVIYVQDTGPGISDDQKQLIFDRFQQVEDDDTRRFGGTGLGLAIVKEFVEMHSGSVAVDNAPEHGSRFSVCLPLRAPEGSHVREVSIFTEADYLQQQDAPYAEVINHSPAQGDNVPLILVVEDNQDMSHFLTSLLSPKYRVVQAFDGQDGLQKALALRPALLVSDIMLPEMSGVDMVMAIRDHADMAYLSIVVLTAKADEALRVNLLNSYIQDYIEKPFVAEEFQARVENLIARQKMTDARLGMSESRFEATFELAAIGFAILSADGYWLRVNRKLCELLGYTQEELLHTSYKDITFAEDLLNCSINLERVLTGELHSYTAQKRYIRKDGSLIWVNISITMVRGGENTSDYFISVIEDIQARKLAEAALQEAQQLARLGNWSWDLVTDTHKWSEEVYRIYGINSKLPPLQYPQIADLFCPQSWQKLQAAVDTSIREGSGYECDAKYFRADGSYGWVMARGKPIVNAKGEVIKLYGTIQDITERKETEEQLRKLALAVEQSPEGILITNLKGQIEYANNAYLQNCGFTLDELIGKNPNILNSGKTSEGTFQSFWEAMFKHQSWQGEFINKRKNGEEYVVFSIISSLRQEDGEISHYVAVQEDITEKKRVTQELEQYRSHLEALVEERTMELQAAQAKADAANAAKTEFLANMSHEIRTPMNAIIGLTYLLKQTNLTISQSERLQKIENAGQHLMEIINNILELSKIEAGRLELDHSNFSPLTLLQQVHGLIAEQANAKGLTVRVDCGDMPESLCGDPTRLRQALLNYASNAIKFTQQGSIVLRCRMIKKTEHGLLLRFEVQDSGIGIENGKHSQIFKAFTQADTSTTRMFGGTGLGLTITRRLVKLMGGEVGVESTLNQGSTFWFTVEVQPGVGDVYAETELVSTHESEKLLQQRFQGAQILVVDDSSIGQMVVTDMLRSVGLQVLLANNGVEAIDIINQRDCDLVLMDTQMPEMDGLQATRLIRENDRFTNLPILAMTATAFDEDRRNCMEAGMNDFISKPVNPTEFYGSLLYWLNVNCSKTADVRHDEEISSVASLSSASTSIQNVASANLLTIPGLDMTQGLSVLNGDADKYQQLLRTFASEHSQDMNRVLNDLGNPENHQQMRRVIHNLKGITGTLGMRSIYRLLGKLDVCLAQNSDHVQCTDIVLHCVDEFTQLLNAINSQLTPAESIDEPEEVLDAAATDAVLQSLENLLLEDNVLVASLIEQHTSMLKIVLDKNYAQFIHLVDKFDYDAALQLLREKRGMPGSST